MSLQPSSVPPAAVFMPLAFSLSLLPGASLSLGMSPWETFLKTEMRLEQPLVAGLRLVAARHGGS